MRAPYVVIGAIGASLLLLGVTRLGTFDGREDIDLRDWVGTDSWSQQMTPGARMATDELCDDDLPCVQAMTSETLTMYRFDTELEAAEAARTFGHDAYLSHWIVVRFEPGGLTAQQRLEFGQSLDCVDVGIADDGREC